MAKKVKSFYKVDNLCTIRDTYIHELIRSFKDCINYERLFPKPAGKDTINSWWCRFYNDKTKQCMFVEKGCDGIDE